MSETNLKMFAVFVLVAEGVWRVSVTTSDVRDAWTEGARVAVVLCGDKRDSLVQRLVTDDKRVLRRGCTAHFVVLSSSISLSSLC